jgi:hypothetical protein
MGGVKDKLSIDGLGVAIAMRTIFSVEYWIYELGIRRCGSYGSWGVGHINAKNG